MSNTEIIDYIRKSFELKNQGFYKPAIEMLYKALALDGDNLEILAQLAHVYRLLGNFQRAVYYVEKVLELDPKHLDCLYLLEEVYIAQGYLQLAKNIASRIYEVQPTNANLAKQVHILNQLQEFEEVKEIEASTSNLDDEVLYEIACAYNENYEPEKALELLDSGYRKNNKNEKIMFLLGKIYYEKNDFVKSKKILSELEKLNPSAEVLNYMGLFKLDEQNITQAIKYFAKAQKKDDKNAEYAYNLASAYFLNGWTDEALKFFNLAICLEPDNINYHYSLAYLYYQKKHYDKSLFELDFIKGIEQHHELSNVLNALITAKKGDILTAKAQLEKIVKFNKDDDFACFALGEIYMELSQIDLAREMTKHALELSPNSLDYMSQLAEIEFSNKNYQEALKLAEKILEINENYLYGLIAMAKISLELKDFDQVYNAAQDIIELDSNCPEGYYYNALALFEQGDKVFAVESMKKAISLDLNNALLYVKISELYQDLGDFRQAYDWAKEACEVDERNYKYKWLCAKIAVALRDSDAAGRHYSQAYRLGSFDMDLTQDYAKHLNSIGKSAQAEKLLKK